MTVCATTYLLFAALPVFVFAQIFNVVEHDALMTFFDAIGRYARVESLRLSPMLYRLQ